MRIIVICDEHRSDAAMLFLKRISREKVWGSPRLKRYGADTPETGSVYSVSGIGEINCGYQDADTNMEGNLYKLSQDHPAKLGLKYGEVYPLIIDMLGADKDLSIQVHPQDEFAKELGFDYGKTESWFVIDAPKKGSFYGGIKKSKISELTDGELSTDPLKFVDTVPVKRGDYLFVPNGTVHAIRAGALVYEIQQSTDITYRIFDYNRLGLNGKPRQLHVREALESIIPTNRVQKRNFAETGHVDEKAYSLDLLKFKGTTDIENKSDIAAALTVITGKAVINRREVLQGGSIMIMPKEKLRLDGDATGILATPKMYWRKLQ